MTGPRPVLDSGLGSGQGIWEVATSPTLKVGTRGSLEDGRVFYYARSSGPQILAGRLLRAVGVDSENEDLAVNTAQIGDANVTVTFGTTTADANDYAGGYLFLIDAAAEGITHEILSHAAVTSGGSIVINLKDPIYIAFQDVTTVTVMKNLWQDLVAVPVTAPVSIYAGVPQVRVPAGNAGTAQYFWSQTWGASCGTLDDSNLIAGAPLTASTRLAGGGGMGFSTGQKPDIAAINLGPSERTENNPVFLKISQ